MFVEEAELLSRQDCGSQQYLFKFSAPQCAHAAQPGQFIELGSAAHERRRLLLMRANAKRGTIEILCNATEPSLSALATKPIGEKLSMTGPLGQGFKPHADRPRAVLIGAGDGIAPTIFLAEVLHDRHDAPWKPLVFLGSDAGFPFRMRPSTIIVDGMPAGAIAGLSFLDEQGIASRLSSYADLPGCYDGSIVDLADAWLATLNDDTLKEVELFVCCSTSLLNVATQAAQKFNVACQLLTAERVA